MDVFIKKKKIIAFLHILSGEADIILRSSLSAICLFLSIYLYYVLNFEDYFDQLRVI